MEYLGITLDYSKENIVEIGASSYIDKALEAYGDDIKGKAKMPAMDDLFQVDEDAIPLKEERRKKYH